MSEQSPPLMVAHWLDREADVAPDSKKSDKLREASRTIRELWARVSSKRRSTPQHKRYMALCQAAHKHWPSKHPVQAGSWHGLRAFLQIKAGFGKVNRIVDERTGKDYVWFEHESVSYENMPQDQFHILAQKVEDIIVDVIGVPADKLLEMDRNEV